MEKQASTLKGIIYFDGLCMACSAEINHYKKLNGSENFGFVDITSPDFQATEHGLDPHKVHRVMHVKDKDGVLHEGVDAFRAIWSQIPRYQFLARLSDNKVFRSGLELGYKGFSLVRPYLPRKKLDCSASPYCEVRK